MRFILVLILIFIQQVGFAGICTSRTSDGKQLFPDERFNQGYYGKNANILVTCDNRGINESQDIYLRFHYPVLDSIKIYEIGEGGALTFLEDIGDWVPASSRTTNVRKPTFKLSLDANTKKLFQIDIHSEGSLQLNHEFLDSNLFIKAIEREAFILAIYYGIVFALMGYNLFLFVQTRQIVFILYVFYLLFYSIFMANMDGISHLYLWKKNVWWSNYSTNIIIPIFLTFMIWFSVEFLKIREYSPKLNKACTYFGMLMACYATFAFFLPYRITSVLGALLSVITILILIVLGLSASAKQIVARYYTVAWSCLFLGMLTIALRNLRVISGSTLEDYAMHIGSGSEAILLSLGLGANIRRVENEKIIFEKRAGNLTIVSQSMQNLAHDIKNQLAVFELISAVKTWEEYLGWKPDMTKAINRIHAIIAEFKRDVEEIALRIRADSIDINGIATEANKTMGSDSVEILAESETDSYQMMIDKVALERSVFNLITNAVEAGAHMVTIQSKAESSNLVVSVIDNGPGVPDGMLAKLFQRGQSFGKPGGQGIGLFNVKSIVAGHGGTIEYRRENGLTIFEMVLPGVILKEPKAVQSNLVANPDSKEQPAQSSVLISIGSMERQEQIWAALANYPFKIYLKETQENIPSFVFTDNHEIMEKYMSIGVPIMMENGKDDPEKIARQIARRVRSQQLPRKFVEVMEAKGGVPLRGDVECEDC